MTGKSRDHRAVAEMPAEEALPLLLEEHGARLYGLGLKLCGHAEDAEDLVQEIFLIALRKWHQFNGESHPTTWLYTIAAHACARLRRKRAGEPQTIESLDELLPRPEGQIPDLDQLDGPLGEQIRRESREAVERAVAGLPIHFRMPLILKEIAELPMADIAAILDVKEATVKTRVHRARLLLRRELSQAFPGQPGGGADHSQQQMCLDLLKAKQDALDRGVPFRVPSDDICERCQTTFETLDLARNICQDLGRGLIPESLRRVLLDAFEDATTP